MNLGDWLRSIGLERYEVTFRENAIDETVLPDLSEDHLRELGFPLGVRLKLLKSIAALSPAAATQGSARDGRLVPSVDSAERRQITVLFSDLVGSTALSTRMDPEDLREVFSAYQKCVADTVGRLGGFVAKYMGDGVLVYFGYPQAHEDDAERAVQAGLELISAVAALKSAVALQTRVGIATGLVVVGDLIGSGEAQERGIVGETPNLAARLQGIAEPNSVVIAEDTRRFLGKLFELQDLGVRDLKGFAKPVRVWAALRTGEVESRFEALRASSLTALVGREQEIELLLRRWTSAKGGEGQVVLLSGEAGIGKSRLTATLLERVADESHTRLRYFCSPQHTDSAFYPVIGQIERAAGLVYDDAAQSRLDKLDALLARTSLSKEDAALFAEMLSLPNDGRHPALDLTAQQRRQKTMEALGSQIEALSRQDPLLMILEDAHWADPTTLELFGRIVDQISRLRILLLVTFRPEFQPPWIGRSHVSALTLNRLAQNDIAAMIDRVVGDKHLPINIRHDIIERTDGIPLFIEEMTKAVLEAEGESETRRIAAAGPSPKVAVPTSLHASLMARLDRLGAAKEVAQIGAAIGREFPYALLAAVVQMPEAQLNSTLDRLTASGLLFRRGFPPEAICSFKHALVRDAAYGTLLRDPRRALHARIAVVLERQFAEIVESQPELQAHHCTEGGLIEQAARLWATAGQRALSRSALVEAASHLSRALGLMENLPGTPTLRREQIKLQVELLTVLMHVKGYGAPDTKAAADRARSLIENAEMLGEPPEDPFLLFSVLYGFWVVNVAAFDGDIACGLAEQFLALAERQRMIGALMLAHRMIGMTRMSIGDLIAGRMHLDQALALYDPTEHRVLANRFGTDARVAILEWRSRTLWLQGYPDAARKDVNDSFSGAREIGQAATLMHALAHSTLTLILCGDYSAADARAKELIVLADEKGSLYWKANAMMWQGCVLALTGGATEAIKMLPPALAAYRSTAATIYTPFVSLHLARAYLDVGQTGEAWHHLDEAMTTAARTQEKWAEAEIHRIAGEIALVSREADAAKAVACFERALAISRSRQAKSFELRATMSMARLWRDQGKREEARDLLAPIYGWFTEGFDTVDLKEAKDLLDGLTS